MKEAATYSTLQTRNKAIAALSRGMSVAETAAAFGMHRATVHRWHLRVKNEGSSGLNRRTGSGRPRSVINFTRKQVKQLTNSSALKYGFESDLWTCQRLQEVLDTHFGVKISQVTLWRRLRDANLTYKKPEKKYIEASETDRAIWKAHVVPIIRKTARENTAIIYCQDEANISLSAVIGKTWSPRGKPAKQEVSGKRGGVAAISAISGSGHLIFQLLKKRVASTEVIYFLGQMLKHHPRRHLVVVMDNGSPHKSKVTREYIQSQKRLHVFYFPKYSPDWNPDEKVWNHLKHHELKGHRAKTTDELYELAEKKLTGLSNSPSKIRGIFHRCCVADLLK